MWNLAQGATPGDGGVRLSLEETARRVLGDEFVVRLGEALGESGRTRAWIVGGAVRDVALGHEVGDVDLAVDGDPAPVAEAVAAKLGGHAFELSEEFPTWRAGDRHGTWQVDVATLRGDSIEQDLGRRDFTVGAMAVSLEDGEAIDPTGGIADLRQGVLRPAGPRAFSDDPLRLMRAARLSAQFGWTLDPQTVELGLAASGRASEPAGERILAELCLLMASRDPVAGLAAMELLGLFETLLPEVGGMRGVVQGPNHHLDVYGHTIEVLEGVLRIESELDRFVGVSAPGVSDLLEQPLADGVTRSTGLRLAALFHDCAKPATRREADGFISFRGHDRQGAEAVLAVFSRLKSSRRLAGYVADLTRNHLILGFMVPEQPLSRRQVYEYLKRTEPYSADVTLLTVADRLAARGTSSIAGREMVAGHMRLAGDMVAEALEWDRNGPPGQFLAGDELASELGIDPGPELGRVIDELAAARFAGEVDSASDAVEWARRFLETA